MYWFAIMASLDPISCRRFRAQHAAWVDLELERNASLDMERHVAGCLVCARHDTGVRRALLVARNLPELRPSADFHATLERRLVAERIAQRASACRHRPPTVRAVTALAASLIAMAWLAERRPAAGVASNVALTVDVPAEIPALPRPVVLSAPLRNVSAVRVVSVQRTSEPQWMPGPPEQPVTVFASAMMPVSYGTLIGR